MAQIFWLVKKYLGNDTLKVFLGQQKLIWPLQMAWVLQVF